MLEGFSMSNCSFCHGACVRVLSFPYTLDAEVSGVGNSHLLLMHFGCLEFHSVSSRRVAVAGVDFPSMG